jgi:hypothetical protein
MKEASKPRVCPECGANAPRWIPEDVCGTFNLETKGMNPQNTGVQQVDTNWDRVIGKDSETKWTGFAAHYKDKEKFMREHGVGRDSISRNPDGSYRVLKPEEKGVHQRAIQINKAAMDAVGTPPKKI